MSEDDVVRDLLLEARRDWIYEVWVYTRCRAALRAEASDGEPRPEVVRRRAIELVEGLLLDGLLVAGDVTTAGFTAWRMTAEEMASTVRARWSRAPEPGVDVGSVAWFDLTDAGEAWLAEALGE